MHQLKVTIACTFLKTMNIGDPKAASHETGTAGFVTKLSPNDVLFGRGAPAIENEGNVRFRKLVQSRKTEYVSTGKRQMKDWIARQVMQAVAQRKGRFLRKIESLVEAEQMGVPDGVTAWAFVDDETVLQKVKQALRDRDVHTESDKKEMQSDVAATALAAAAMNQPTQLDTESLESATRLRLLNQSTAEQKVIEYLRNQQLREQALADIQGANMRQLLRSSQGMRATLPNTFAAGLTGSPIAGALPGDALPDLTFLMNRQLQSQMQSGVLDSRGLHVPGLNLQVNSSPFLSQGNAFSSLLQGSREADRGALLAQAFQVQASQHNEQYDGLEHHKLSPSPGMRSLTGALIKREETNGDRAIHNALENINRFDDKPTISLSLIEIYLLCALCSHGIPVCPPLEINDSFTKSASTSKRGFGLSWVDMGELVAEVAKDWSSHSKYCPTHALIRIQHDKTSLITERSGQLAATLRYDPRELARRLIMLMEKIRLLSCRQIVFEEAKTSSHHEKIKTGIEVWFEQELSRWSSCLEIIDSNGRPVPYSSEDFCFKYGQYARDVAFIPVAQLDEQGCKDIYTQAATLSRLRSIFLTNYEEDLYPKIERAQVEIQVSNRFSSTLWNTQGNSLLRDVTLLESLLRKGFTGIISALRGQITVPGLSKAVIQERATELTFCMHKEDESSSRQRVLQNRIDHFMSIVSPGQAEGATYAAVGRSETTGIDSESGATIGRKRRRSNQSASPAKKAPPRG
jgi:hypothetical protein